MSRSVQRTLPPMELKPLAMRPEIACKAGLKGVSTEVETTFTDLVAAICGERLSEKEIAAVLAKGNPSLWSRIKAHESGCNVKADDLWDLPLAQQQQIVRAWAERLGLTVLSHDRKKMAIAKLVSAAADALLAVEESA